jgi:hypothetical protein
MLTRPISSTIIHSLWDHCREDDNRTLAYYYFDSTDATKGDVPTFLRSLIRDLSTSPRDLPTTVRKLYEERSRKPPEQDEWTGALLSIIQDSREKYIIIDALDECNRLHWESLLDLLSKLFGSGVGNLHILVTSRDGQEDDLDNPLREMVKQEFDISLSDSFETTRVNEDIKTFVNSQLYGDKAAKIWKHLGRKDEQLLKHIETSVVSRAEGMWVTIISPNPEFSESSHTRIQVPISCMSARPAGEHSSAWRREIQS